MMLLAAGWLVGVVTAPALDNVREGWGKGVSSRSGIIASRDHQLVYGMGNSV